MKQFKYKYLVQFLSSEFSCQN